MFCITVTVHDHNELDCRSHSLTEHFNHAGQLLEMSPEQIKNALNSCKDTAIEHHRASYPRGRSFVIPVVEIQVTPNASGAEIAARTLDVA